MKIGEKLKKIIGTVAPTLGSALGGPLGGMAGRAIQDALGVDTEQAALQAIESNPNALLELKKAEQAFETRLAELGIDLERIHHEDRANARARQIALKDHTPAILTYLLTALFASAVAYILVNGIPENGGEALMLLLGQLSAGFGAGVAYHLGSSAGSKQKTDIMGGGK